MYINKKIPVKVFWSIIKTELLIVTIYMLFIGYIDEFVHAKGIAIPLTIPAILGTALSFLLGFRINQAYERWWEARINWGAIVNDSRTLVRQAMAFLKKDNYEVNTIVKKIANRQMAWCYSLGQSLRSLNPTDNIVAFFDADEFEFLKQQKNVPNAILSLISLDIRNAFENGDINEFQQIKLENTIEKLTDSMGKCERIKSTVFPVMYSILVHASIYLFVMLLPFGLVDFLGYVEVPLVISISTMFFVIEKTTFRMQNPFENKPGDTAMTSIARTIEINIRQMLGEKELPKPIEAEKFYIM